MKKLINIAFVTFLAMNSFIACTSKINAVSSEPSSEIDKKFEELKNSIVVPTFPDKKFNVLDFGAIADETTDNTKAFADAIDKCNSEGGGIVIVPKGKYFTGPIHLKSNVNFHLEKGSELLFSTDNKAYLPVVHTSFEGNELMNYSPLVYAYKQKNVALTGEGILNGQANNENWWPWAGAKQYGYIEGMPKHMDAHNKDRLMGMSDRRVPVEERIFGEGHQFRPLFFQTVMCENILLEGVTFINAPFWVIHPFKSKNVTVDGVTVKSHGPNNDGCDPEYSSNVRIANCHFDTGDDCIAIKSGRNEDGRRVNIPSENIMVENCTMIDGHGGVVIGSEISAGVRNVYVRNCVMNSPELDRAIRIKTNTTRGGFVENVYVKDIMVGQVKEAVLKITTTYGVYGEPIANHIPEIKNIVLENVKVKNGGKYAILIDGRPENPISGIEFKNVTIDKVGDAFKIEHCEEIQFTNTKINGKLYHN
ncbi:glycoside hydrolase family 28 protein [Moheibacter sediminis]|uniref:Pectate lyase superfamily protein n=1 Tax=Moheibacter sediminis TaxID=1434700 RepID=A0A1W2CXY9_9FLAO|nr:glycoside hydrolase family 28 protein [Moheibacter sediminis]SMC90087.1 Pectate lyase superfamily protein [Moheibacter sediminis]